MLSLSGKESEKDTKGSFEPAGVEFGAGIPLRFSKEALEKDLEKLPRASEVGYKDVPDNVDVDSKFVYYTRRYDQFLPAFLTINSVVQSFMAEGRTKEVEEMFVLQMAGGFCQFGSILDHMGLKHAIIDITRPNLMHGKSHGTEGGIVATAQELPLKDGSVSMVVSDHFLFSNYGVIRYLEYPILEESRRVLKKGGLLIITQTPRISLPASHAEHWRVLYDEGVSEKLKVSLAILRKRD